MSLEYIGQTDQRGKDGSVICDFRCSCGNIYQSRKYDVTKGRVVSCGCAKKTAMKKANQAKAYNDPAESSFNSLYGGYKIAAAKRGLPFDLDKTAFHALTEQDCHYCGSQPAQEHRGTDAKQPYVYNGVDRVNNSEGYTTENSVSCCGICNKMKLTLSYEEFINHIKQILCHSLRDKT